MDIKNVFLGISLALALFQTSVTLATTPIQFNPNGTGATGAVTVGVFDWTVGNAVALSGNPPFGLAVGSKVIVLSQARLGSILDPNGNPLPLPAGTEFTFVAGAGEQVTSCSGVPCDNASFAFDPAELTQNFFEIWVSTPDVNNLAGTGFNNTQRILFGKVNDALANYASSLCGNGNTTDVFDQFVNNDWPNTLTVCGAGGTTVSVQVLSLDPNYFPGFTPDLVANLKAKFNTSNIDPYNQVDPSRQFIGNDAGVSGLDPEPVVIPNLGPINGLPDGLTTQDFQFQADANQAFEQGQTVSGACRVTYGGNDKNGNIAPNSFGQGCASDKGNKVNCYTFGGQVGAPTANTASGGPFGEHTHHNVSGPAGDFVFHAGTHSAPKSTRITATACKDPGACRQAEANAGFKQIDFEGTGSFRTLDATAQAYLAAKAGHPVLPDNADTQIYYFRVDMDDTGEPGDKPSKNKFDINACSKFLAADQNFPLSTPDPLLNDYASCNACADVYQFYICKDQNPCEQKDAIYAVRGYLTGGNIQIHKIVK